MTKFLIPLPVICFFMAAWSLYAAEGDPVLKMDWGQWGLAGMVVGATMLLSFKREKRMEERMDKQQEWIQTKLIKVLERVADAPCQDDKEGS